ncbi:hypothetical protein TPHA_0L00640 [Tetrapisispora phaffii CBS 4417]|uniref:FUN14 domain-containing protein n=1 Tax=Tetrapisispora phaffii (strain ATCC 24235 / CBS 4417 / NBRC 1672 / NRRL Y-8282 / UCD 70-5) TaxID=1071381 RepID=G8BZU2_TETPH|nr:hypothetical protein TPHA_0L00640 [Tetrapisispora phaffii CBS 4417]CCE65420.1 hypothetical protein TPHA_0L00640 [Tetrapisispora phaffii CBS 4417]
MFRFGVGHLFFKRNARKMVGGMLTGSALLIAPPGLLYNDSAVSRELHNNVFKRLPTTKREERKAIYRDMCWGSIVGVASGILIAKVSSILIYVAVFTGLAIEWMKNKGYVDKEFITGSTSTILRQVVHKNYNLNRPLFKVSFMLSFIIAAFNF